MFACAFVLGKLEAETLLCLGHALQCGQRNLELPVAQRAHCYGRDASKPLQNAKVTFRHDAVRCAAELAHGLFNFRDPARTLQHFAGLGTIRRAHDAVLFHQIDQMCGAPVTDAQPPFRVGIAETRRRGGSTA